MINPIFSCPLCGHSLKESGNSLLCESNHCFDRAKQGYWNLLAVQQKKSLDPGDNAVMVQARSQFLDVDHYLPLALEVEKILASQLQHIDSAQVLDMGCGEGYYTAKWHRALPQHQCIGLDISKHAIKAATKRSKKISWLVASGANIPVADHGLDAMTVLFSRLMPEPFAKKLKTDALLIFVWPTKEHLIELKEIMYGDIKASQYDPITELSPYFSLQEEQVLSFTFNIPDPLQLNTLLLMTPHGQRINQECKDNMHASLPMKLSFSVNIACFRKRETSDAQ